MSKYFSDYDMLELGFNKEEIEKINKIHIYIYGLCIIIGSIAIISSLF